MNDIIIYAIAVIIMILFIVGAICFIVYIHRLLETARSYAKKGLEYFDLSLEEKRRKANRDNDRQD